MKHNCHLSAYFSGLCLGLCALALALLSGCGGGSSTATADITDAGGAVSFPPLTMASAPAPTACAGVMLAGSTRWCIGGDGTVKDMTTNTVWLQDGACSGKVGIDVGKAWAAGLASGQCGLTDASNAGDWAMPESPSALLALTQGSEPASDSAPRAFTNLNNHSPWWAGWAGSTPLAVEFDASAIGYGKYATDPKTQSYVLPYRKYADNRVTSITSGRGYSLAPAGVLNPVAGTSYFTRSYLTSNPAVTDYTAAYVALSAWDNASRTPRIFYFDADPDNAGYFRIRYAASGGPVRYLQVIGNSIWPGANVIGWPDVGGDNRRWQPQFVDGGVMFKSKLSGLCMHMENDGVFLHQNTCDSTNSAQVFVLTPRQDIVRQAADPKQTVCDGVMLAGSTRWCIGGDSTVKDMTTNRVWLSRADCADMKSYSDASAWTASLSSGSCDLTDASKAGDWAIPKDADLLALTQGAEPISASESKPFANLQPRTFSRIRNLFYWTSTTWMDGQLYSKVVTFDDSRKPTYGQTSQDGDTSFLEYTLPYRRYSQKISTTLDAMQGYALAASTALIAVPGTSDSFTRRFINQIQYTFCCQNASRVVLWDWDDDRVFRTYRIWYFIADKDGYFRIRSQPLNILSNLLGVIYETHRYLAVENAVDWAGANIIAWPDAGGDNHLWFPVLNADNTWTFKNKKSGLCMQWQSNKNDESLVQQNCAPGSPNQSFTAFPRG